MNTPIRLPKLLMPRPGTDLSKWAVVACDQYTSQPDYWAAADAFVGGAPSTLRLTLPEIYLEQDGVSDRVAAIQQTMRQYLADGTLVEREPGLMLVERTTQSGVRRGVMLAFDLEAYDYKPGSQSLIRPTEKTVPERIPPRLAVRRGAPVELPHIMLLIDDPDRAIIEPLFAQKAQFEQAYDTDLMLNGGHLSGWFVPEGAETDALLTRMARLSDPEVFRAKYNLTGEHAVLPFASGDGNHSMATAKAAWDEIKAGLTEAERETHPARFVLAEVVNVHDESLLIEGIHRVLFGATADEVIAATDAFFSARGGKAYGGTAASDDAQVFPICCGSVEGVLCVEHSPWALPVATLQNFLDDFTANHPDAKIDYIHGPDVVRQLAQDAHNVGFLLPDPAKEDLFRGVILDGVLPRKTFSMGEAQEKRYYMEARRIIPE
ncbi:MAG: DUF1015 domain-containing protein [Clostridiales bacterium]|nr:DUF1015 domain-containing protein [Clostridiales bacterium]